MLWNGKTSERTFRYDSHQILNLPNGVFAVNCSVFHPPKKMNTYAKLIEMKQILSQLYVKYSYIKFITFLESHSILTFHSSPIWR